MRSAVSSPSAANLLGRFCNPETASGDTEFCIIIFFIFRCPKEGAEFFISLQDYLEEQRSLPTTHRYE